MLFTVMENIWQTAYIFINALFFDTIDGFLGQQHGQHRLKDLDNSITFHQLSILLKHLRTAYKQE